MIKNVKNIVVISPHPDDETLGLGGTMKRFSDLGININVLVVSGHLPPIYNKKDFQTTKIEALNAFNELGVKNYEFLEIPATFVNEEHVSTLNKKISSFINLHRPEMVFIPFPDRHIDHRVIFDGSVVACRPIGKNFPKFVNLFSSDRRTLFLSLKLVIVLNL